MFFTKCWVFVVGVLVSVCFVNVGNCQEYVPMLVPDLIESSELSEIPSPPLESAAGSKLLTIFIVFPNRLPVSSYPVNYQGGAWADTISIGTTAHLMDQSNGLVDLIPVTLMNPSHPNGWWVADYNDYEYGDDINGPQHFKQYWYGSTFAHLGEVQAEILFKVYERRFNS